MSHSKESRLHPLSQNLAFFPTKAQTTGSRCWGSGRSARGKIATKITWFSVAIWLYILATPVNAQLTLASYYLGSIYYKTSDNRFGAAMVAVDLNDDGVKELAIGAPSVDAGPLSNVGNVIILQPDPDDDGVLFSFDYCSTTEDSGEGFRFGASLAVGDFDGDGVDDLVVGMPGAEAGPSTNAGAVCVIYGGNVANYNELLRVRFSQEDTPGLSENGDEFGHSLATGDLNGDGYDELAIGAPGEDLFDDGINRLDAGSVHVLFGGEFVGLQSAGSLFVSHGISSDLDARAGERLGSSLAIGDLYEDGPTRFLDDLAIGVPFDTEANGGGSVYLYSGDEDDLLLEPGSPFNADSADVLGTSVAGDEFGHALVSGDFDSDGFEDLAVGIPGDNDLAIAEEAGAVMVFYGPVVEFSDREQVFYESIIDGHQNGVRAFDRFGEVLAKGDFNMDTSDDLVIGAPLDDVFDVSNTGEVTVIYGTETGLSLVGVQVFADILFGGQFEADNQFGAGIAVGRLSGAATDVLAVGIPNFDFLDGALPNIGNVRIIQSALLFSDAFESGDVTAWE